MMAFEEQHKSNKIAPTIRGYLSIYDYYSYTMRSLSLLHGFVAGDAPSRCAHASWPYSG